MIRVYLNRPAAGDEELASELVRAAVSSVAKTCIIPLQDYLRLDNRARINFPSTLGTNWRWRMTGEELTKELAASIRKLCQMYGRV